MNANDQMRLLHMLENAELCLVFIQGQSRLSLDKDLKLVYALLRAVEVIGEAASKISRTMQETTPQIPWKQIIGMRNILIHDYNRINLDRLWDTVAVDLPTLIAEIKKLLSQNDLTKDNE